MPGAQPIRPEYSLTVAKGLRALNHRYGIHADTFLVTILHDQGLRRREYPYAPAGKHLFRWFQTMSYCKLDSSVFLLTNEVTDFQVSACNHNKRGTGNFAVQHIHTSKGAGMYFQHSCVMVAHTARSSNQRNTKQTSDHTNGPLRSRRGIRPRHKCIIMMNVFSGVGVMIL